MQRIKNFAGYRFQFRKEIVITLFIITILSTSPVTHAQVSEEMYQANELAIEEVNHFYNFDKIQFIIFYDGEDTLTNNTGLSLYDSLSLLTPDVVAIPVTKITEIENALANFPYFAAIYAFQSDYNGLKIHRGNQLIPWIDISEIIQAAPMTHHILAMGNSRQLLNIMPADMLNYVHGSGDEKVDANQVFVYTLWTLADILEANQSPRRIKLGNDVRMATLQYFADNFNDLATASVEATSPLGEESPEVIQARVDKYYEDNPGKVTKLAPDGYVIDPVTQRQVDANTGELRQDYGIDIFPIESASAASDFILDLLPLDSGQRGPIGGILDTLLGYLIDKIGEAIGLDAATVSAIVDALVAIPDLVGAISNPSGSAIKSFIDKLKPLLPIPESMYKYVDLLIDGLFALRGTEDDIKGFISSAIGLLIPDDLDIGGVKLKDLLSGILDLGTGLVNKIQEGGNIMDIILSVMNENILVNLTSTFIGKDYVQLGLDTAQQAAQAISKVVAGVKFLVNTVSTGNIKDLIYDYGPKLLTTIFEGLGINSTLVEIIFKGVGVIMDVAGIMQGNGLTNFKDLLAEMLKNIKSNIVESEIYKSAEKIVKSVGQLVEGKFDQLSILTANVSQALTALNVDEDIIKAIQDVSAMVVAISREDFDLSGVSSISTMVANFLKGFDVTDAGTIDNVKQIIDGVFGVFSYIKDVPNFKKIVGDVMSGADITQQIAKTVKAIINLVKPDTFSSQLNIDYVETDGLGIDTASDIVNTASEAIGLILKLLNGFNGNSLQAIMMSLLQGGSYLISQFTGVDISGFVKLFKGIFGQFLGLSDSMPTTSELVSTVAPLLGGAISTETLTTIVDILLSVLDVFQNGFQSIFAKLTEFLIGKVTDLISSLTGEIGGILGSDTWELVNLEIPIGIGAFSLFTIKLSLGLEPHIEFDVEKLTSMILDLVFKGTNFFNPSDGGESGSLIAPSGVNAGDILRQALSFFSISPVFVASFELSDFGSGSSGFLTFMLEALGVELEISGYGFFKMLLFSFKNGVFSFDNFFKVLEWGFGFSITISRTFTLLDFLTGGAGGSLNSIGKYIGLDAISITIYFTIALDVVKRAATAIAPETGSLTISLTVGFTVSLGIDIFIAELRLTGTLEITLTLLQDLVSSTPMRVFISIVLIITVTIGFLFWDWDFDFRWSPDGFEPPLGYELTPSTPEDAVKEGALGGDTDGDGLSDTYEDETPGLDKTKADTDGDTLSDKYETQTLKTDPAQRDTDGDGLDDNVEMDLTTNPLQPDTDFDGLNDYQEAVILGTDPHTQDTDKDGLSDFYEVNHAWNVSGVTPTVTEIMIGGVVYNDRTDPLNPDTDADGLLDGMEGERGINYGGEVSYCENGETDQAKLDCKTAYQTYQDAIGQPDEEAKKLLFEAEVKSIMGYVPDPAIIFNNGYTHPLDADTDDDSGYQLYDGSIAPMDANLVFLMDMSDYIEITGISVIFIDTETGEPEPARIVRTNPVNPDSDGDTGITQEQIDNPPFGYFINSDGYELSRDPPTDPLDGDTDDDGLIDGLEGMLRPDSNHTWGLNPDTDGDGLGDYQELELGTDGLSIDTDRDGVTDGDEYFIYGTNPFLEDTDSDGLLDSEELFIFHCSPHLRDSDGDGLSDYDEVWVYFSKPADEDSDNDFLTDWEEIMIYYTDPFNEDTDFDGLLDGEEIEGFEIMIWNGTARDGSYIPTWVKTDPTRWDTDNDSITALDQYGKMSQSMSDLEEYLMGLDPTNRDSDQDGIKDGWEVYLGTGKAPWFEPMHLNASYPDTDGDGLDDGVELQIVNSTMLINPYISFTFELKFNSRPDMLDTDFDGLNDTKEIMDLHSRADTNDTDGDMLSDYEEYLIYKTDLHSNDTDGDGLSDYDELHGFNASDYGFPFNTIFVLDPKVSDTDGDLIPDGAEIKHYVLDPTNPDEIGNSGAGNEILDGMEIDADKDGLYAGEEFYVYETAGSPDATAGKPGGDNNPDSDGDGLFDGLEVYEVGSKPNSWDTDHDNFSDGLEYYCGTGILDNSTTQEDIQGCFSGLVRIAILSPASKTYYSNNAPVHVFDSTYSMTTMSYKYREYTDEAEWSGVKGMSPGTQPGYWFGDYLSLPVKNATYELEVTASNATNSYTRSVKFSVEVFSDLKIINPEPGIRYSYNEFQDPEISVEVQTPPEYNATWFRLRYVENATLFTGNITMSYSTGSWKLSTYTMPDIRGTTEYAIEVFAQKTNGDIIMISAIFSIKLPTILENVAIVLAPPVIGGTVFFAVKKSARSGFKNPFKKKKT